MRSGAMSDVFTVQSHRTVTVFAAKLGYPIAQGVGDRRDHPLPPFYAAAAKELLHFALVDFLTHISQSVPSIRLRLDDPVHCARNCKPITNQFRSIGDGSSPLRPPREAESTPPRRARVSVSAVFGTRHCLPSLAVGRNREEPG